MPYCFNPFDWAGQNYSRSENCQKFKCLFFLTGAYVDLKTVKMVATSSSTALKSDAVFEFIIDQVKADPNKAKSVGGVFLYKITKDGKEVKQWSKFRT